MVYNNFFKGVSFYISVKTPYRRKAESECSFEKASWCVSLVVIVASAILGTIQEVMYRQAADRVFRTSKHSSTKTSTTKCNRAKVPAGCRTTQ